MPNVTGGSGKFGGSAQANKDKDTGKTGSTGGAGTKALTGALSASYDKGALSNVGAGPTGKNALGGSTSSTGKRTEGTGSDRPKGGGTTVQKQYVPGSVPNFPDADPLTNLGKAVLFGPTGPIGTATTLGRIFGQGIGLGDASPFTDVGVQDGWQPDRDRNLDGSPAVDEPRALPGIRGAGTAALTGDIEEDSPPTSTPGTDAVYSDVMLQDKRKPYPPAVSAGTRMMLGLR